MTLGRGLPLVRLTFLGTSAAQPTISRNLSGLAVKAGGELLLFDCGEGTQRQMVRFGTGFGVDAVFFTHFHADHFLGIIGFLRTLGMQGREQPLDLYGPSPASRLLDQAIHIGIDTLAFEVRIHELAPGDRVQRDSFSVQAIAAQHRVNTIAYLFAEDPRPGKFDVQKARALGVEPGPDYTRLQNGDAITLGNGRIVKPEEVVAPPRPGRRFVVSGDTRPCPSVVEAARGADLLIHEATFSDAEQARAIETMHSTAREAAQVAHEAGVERLALTHFSSRFEDDTSVLEAEAKSAFGGPIDLAYDGYVLELPAREG